MLAIHTCKHCVRFGAGEHDRNLGGAGNALDVIDEVELSLRKTVSAQR